MKIKLSSCVGFCFGVKRAIKLAEAELDKGKKIYSIGPIIHNPQVVDDLSKRGLKIVKDLDEVKEGLFLIPSHGAGPGLLRKADQNKLKTIDTTCPFVMKAQKLVSSLSKDGYTILIVGEAAHPEIRALVDCAGPNAKVVPNEGSIKELDLKNKKISVIAQTTQSKERFNKVVAELKKKDCKELKIFNTICQETVKRQDDTRKLAQDVEVVLVIGGRSSANTARLVSICRSLGKEAYHIENENEINPKWFEGKHTIGISSGASTPYGIVKAVADKLEKKED